MFNWRLLGLEPRPRVDSFESKRDNHAMALRRCGGSREHVLRVFAVLSVLWALPALAQTWTSSQEATNRPAEETPGRSHYRVDSTSTFVAYTIRSPLAPVSLEERRFVEWLSVDHTYEIGERNTQGRTRWRLHTRMQLRIDQEFGRDCTRVDDTCYLGTSDDAPRSYQVLTRRTRLDVPSLSLSAEGPLATVLGVGRQTIFDGAGFVRVDGVKIASTPNRFVSVEIFGGLQVVGTSVAGSSGFSSQGTLRLPLPQTLAPRDSLIVAPESSVEVFGGHVRIGNARYLRAELLFRETRDGSGLVARRVGGSLLSRPWSILSLRARVLHDPALGRIVDALGEVAFALEKTSVRIRVFHHEPTFDLGSIWAYFDIIPVQQAELVAAHTFGDVRLHVALRGRRAIGDKTERDVGGELGALIQLGAWRLGAEGWFWAGDLTPVAFVRADVRRALRDRGEIGLRASLWRFNDPFRDQLFASSFSATLYGGYRLTEYAQVRGEFEYGYNRIVSSRLRGLVSLRVRLWR
ncbi:MAG: hypothetical protein ACI9KE_004399 [Polyangiales bacterium]|jgi:hypothetical protein